MGNSKDDSKQRKAEREALREELLTRCEEEVLETISEEERDQMERNAGNIDFEILNENGSIMTLIKYTVISSVRPHICRQLELIAKSENNLPDPAQHCALLRCLMNLANEDDTCSGEALKALQAAVGWPARIKQHNQDTEELRTLRQKLQTIEQERKALEEQDDLLP